MAKNNIIPIFIPFAGCPHKCIYCNQEEITGKRDLPVLNDIKATIEVEKEYFSNKIPIEVAFYGGTFTMLPFSLQVDYLQLVKNYIDKGIIDSVRISTRPDYIDQKQILKLKDLGLKTVEFGIQSIDLDVLTSSGRFADISLAEKNIHFLKEMGFILGLQQMIGLPQDTFQKSLKTSKWILGFKPDFVRIYPTLVLKNTGLEFLYNKNKYQPLSLEEAILWTSKLLDLYQKYRIDVIRVGLPPLENTEDYISGPYHPQFRELAESHRYVSRILRFLEDFNPQEKILISSSQTIINKIVGPSQYGKNILKKYYKIIGFKNTLNKNIIEISDNNKKITINIENIPWSVVCI